MEEMVGGMELQRVSGTIGNGEHGNCGKGKNHSGISGVNHTTGSQLLLEGCILTLKGL